MSVVDYSVYLVTDAPERYVGHLLANVEAAVAGGATIVQYRGTTESRREQFETATKLVALLRANHVPLIVNDAVDLALAVDADGVHVGQSDLPVDVVRRLIGPEKLLGLSITDAAQLAAVPAGVDYLGIGPVFATATKADAAPAMGLEALREAVARTTLPCVAIGGIDLRNAGSVFATGVAGVAVVSAFSRSAYPADVARALCQAKRVRG